MKQPALLIHYHIFWSDASLDWKPCRMEEEARILAEQIKKRGESYTIIGRDSGCERCKVLRSKATAQAAE